MRAGEILESLTAVVGSNQLFCFQVVFEKYIDEVAWNRELVLSDLARPFKQHVFAVTWSHIQKTCECKCLFVYKVKD